MTKKFKAIPDTLFKSIDRTVWTSFRSIKQPWYMRYGYACIFIVVATIIKFEFFDYVTAKTPFLLYFGVVILAARFGGVGPAVFATIVSGLISVYYFLPPYNSFAIRDVGFIQIALYSGECLLITGFTGALIRADRRLRRSERRFRALIEKSSDGIAMSDITGEILYASPSVGNVLGYTNAEFSRFNGLEKLHPEEAPDLIKKFGEIIKVPGSTTTVLHRYLNRKNEYIWIESTVTNLLEDPHVKAIVYNFRNVTERVLLEKQKEDFIGIATHELKTPVTSIKAYAQLMLNRFRKEGNEQSAKLVEKLDIQLNRLISLITDLLDVTKIQSGNLPMVNEPFEFNKMVLEVVEDLQRTTDKHKIIVKLDKPLTLTGDRERIGQVLTNLISNAIKYSPHADTIMVYVAIKENNVEVCVEDYGVGIDKDSQTKVFERFYRVSGPGSHTFPGLGLGLYISSEIIRRQGGRIWVHSEKGKGSTFCFSLPLQ